MLPPPFDREVAFTYLERRKAFPTADLKLDERIKEVLERKGIVKLYKHQAEGIKLSREGKDVIVVAPTASGKTEVFMIRAVEEAFKGNTTLILYPTKALSRDQLKRFSNFSLYGVRAGVYDGDTPPNERKRLRERPPHILITNFDMLHHILLNHRLFEKFLKNLSLVVVDEIHYYSGILGSHVANILERLERIMRKKYRKTFQYIGSSATLSNTKEFSSKLLNREVEVVEAKGNKTPRKFYLLSPEYSPLSTLFSLLERLDHALIFAESHHDVERLSYLGRQKGYEIYPYRAGYKPNVRKKLEEDFKSGRIPFLVSTSALELGIDIGRVKNAILYGIPPSMTSLRQRIGRAGRRKEKANVYIIAKFRPLDYYYIDHPTSLFKSKGDSLYLNKFNPRIRKIHILSKAKELLLSPEEAEEELLEELLKEGLLERLGKFFIVSKKGKATIRRLNIRQIGEEVKIYTSSGKYLGTRELSMALKELHPSAIYFYLGKKYIVKSLDLKEMKAVVEEFDGSWNTTAIMEKEATVVKTFKEKTLGEITISWGKVRIKNSVIGFIVKDDEGRRLGEHYLEEDLSYEYEPEAVWMSIEPFGDIELFGYGLHAFEHVFINMTPSLCGNSPSELGGLSYPDGVMYVYEGYEGGVGIAEMIFHHFSEIAERAYIRLRDCKCENGCPKCILDPQCGNDNRYLDKKMGKEIGKFVVRFLKDKVKKTA